MCELKLTNNPCKYCNGYIDEGQPLCGDIVDLGDVCCMVKTKEGICILFDNSHPDRCEVISHCGFDLHFLDD